VRNPAKLVVFTTIASKCDPVTGGVIVATAVVPVIYDRNVVGAIDAAAVNVNGAG